MTGRRKTLLILAVITSLLSTIRSPAWADGMIFNPLRDRTDLVNETEQQAFINFENGREKMILSVGWEETASEGLVWVFPVPASPKQISLDVVKQLPRLEGEEIFKKAKEELSGIRKFLLRTQIYPIPLIAITDITFGANIGGLKMAGDFGAGTSGEVTVHEHLEKEGVICELITTKNAEALYDYFQNKGLKIEPSAVAVFDHYIGKDYSFVASWITSLPKESENVRGVYVSFPTEEIYYPLLPTSVYGERIIPTTIRVLGFVTPKVYENIKDQTKTEYYLQETLRVEEETSKFFSDADSLLTLKNFKYTKVHLTAPAKQFTEDLWLTPKAPDRVQLASFISQHPKAIGLALLATISSLLGLGLGIAIFEEARSLKGIGKFFLLGLTNCLTLLALIITIWLMKTKSGGNISLDTLEKLKKGGYFWKRRLAVVALVLALPLVALAILASPFITLQILFEPWFYTNFVLIVILPAGGLVYLYKKLKKIKPEDRPLFEELKAQKYSTWSFHPEDSDRKLGFAILFALLFPVIVIWITLSFGFYYL